MIRDLQPGDPRTVGPYRLVGVVGGGGMGRVYLGLSPGGRAVAVKVIRSELVADPHFHERFRREVAAARRVSGMFTAVVVDADVDADDPWLATAFVAGPSLGEAVREHGPLPVGSALTLAAGLAEGLAAIHAVGVVHRDLKPSNVLLGEDGPRVIDFGISRAAESASLTHAGFVVGSPGFMSPEQAEGGHVGSASDIFCLGSVLAYAVTGDSPFGGGPTAALVYRVVHGEPLLDGIPEPIRGLVERCLEKDPDRRPTAAELLIQAGPVQPVVGWLPTLVHYPLRVSATAAGLSAVLPAAQAVPTSAQAPAPAEPAPVADVVPVPAPAPAPAPVPALPEPAAAEVVSAEPVPVEPALAEPALAEPVPAEPELVLPAPEPQGPPPLPAELIGRRRRRQSQPKARPAVQEPVTPTTPTTLPAPVADNRPTTATPSLHPEPDPRLDSGATDPGLGAEVLTPVELPGQPYDAAEFIPGLEPVLDAGEVTRAVEVPDATPAPDTVPVADPIPVPVPVPDPVPITIPRPRRHIPRHVRSRQLTAGGIVALAAVASIATWIATDGPSVHGASPRLRHTASQGAALLPPSPTTSNAVTLPSTTSHRSTPPAQTHQANAGHQHTSAPAPTGRAPTGPARSTPAASSPASTHPAPARSSASQKPRPKPSHPAAAGPLSVSLSGASWGSCGAVGSLRSSDGPAATFAFYDNSQSGVSIYYIDSGGGLNGEVTLAPGGEASFPTNVGAYWEIVGPGGCLSVLDVAGNGSATIT